MSFAKKIALSALPIALLIAAGYFGYTIYGTYLAYKAATLEEAAREENFVSNRSRLVDALKETDVGSDEILRGFWYSYEDSPDGESVGSFDLDLIARGTLLTDDEIRALAAQVDGAYRVQPSAMRLVPDIELPPELRFHNSLYNLGPGSAFLDTFEGLSARYGSGAASAEELWRLAYMLEMRGLYEMRDEVYASSCEEYGENCRAVVSLTVRGRVVGTSGRPIQGATVRVLSRPDAESVVSKSDGTFTLHLSVKEMEKIRVEAVKRNFSSGVASGIIVSSGRSALDVGTIALGSPISIITIDTVGGTVTDQKSEALPNGGFIVRGERSAYEIPANAIVRKDGTPYRGTIDVYIYEFTRDTVPQNLITLDTFDEVIGYAGNLMLSYGMPFIQFFAQDGEQLDVRNSKPMLLTYEVPAMQEMFDNVDELPGGPVTEAQIQKLLAASRGTSGFPITVEFLAASGIPSYPPFWVLNRQSGVWDNVGIRVIGDGSVIQAPFYTWNDVPNT